jgi:dipeptidyl-peptidase-4
MPEASGLTLARVARYPLPGMNAPVSVRFSPDDRLLTYLWSDDGTLVRQLWAYDIHSGSKRLALQAPGQGDTDSNVSEEEALRRERLRMRGFGVTSYDWAAENPVMLIPMLGRLFVSDGDGGEVRALETGGEATNAQLDRAGKAVAFVREGELWRIDVSPGAQPQQLTFDASAPNTEGERLVRNGVAEFIAQEEMGRSSGFWWSPDGMRIAFAQVDNSLVRPYTIEHYAGEEPAAEVHRYPFAGGTNAVVQLGIIDVDTKARRWLSSPMAPDYYLARVDWAPDGALFAQFLRRDQRRLDLVRYDTGSDSPVTVITEQAPDWLNLHDDLRFVKSAGGSLSDYHILWSSERTGFRHLYLYDREGSELRKLTEGDWPVDRVAGHSDEWVYFLAGRETPLERHVYRVSSAGGSVECLTDTPGVHTAVLSPSGELFADSWDSSTQPPSVCLRAANGTLLTTIFEGQPEEAEELRLQSPEFMSLQADDGSTLHAALYAPLSSDANPPPLIVSVYGGPHVQQVTNSWSLTVDLRSQYLAREGYAVLKLDNRGSARRGHGFEAAIWGDLGNVEVRDQVAGVRLLADRLAIDPQRVGVYGWSYGGYMVLMCLLKAPEVFKAGVAGAPVTDWGGYDTNYTERYMMTPAANGEGYQSSSALQHAATLGGELLIIHGMIDENVHFRHSVRLIDALVRQQKPFELLPFPNERHMPRREEDRVYMEQRVVDHFRRHL